MSVTDEQLSYDYHIGFYKSLGHLTGEPIKDAYWHREAERMHALSVLDAVLDVHLRAGAFAQTITNTAANFQLRFGLGRRTKFIWLSMRGLLSQIRPDRTEPLLSDQVEESARDLNVIYINLRGALDNLAWFLLEMFGGENTRKLAPVKISLFGNEFLKDENLCEAAAFVAEFSDWNKELSSRRDPAAHRIPLSVPPAIIDQETRDRFEQASAAYSASFDDAIQTLKRGELGLEKFEKTNQLFNELEHIGKFAPVFVHHPQEGLIRIYPTVPHDVGQFVRIVRGILTVANAKIA